MTQELYNEGRVVGFSAWEIFARDALDHGIPASEIPDEHEWLTRMMCQGSSIVMKVPRGTTKGVHDFALPEGSSLTAAGVIIGSPFIGDCEWEGNFAKKVISYGPLIQNTSTSSPNASGSNVPAKSDYTDFIPGITEFVKINDGIVFTKSAKWLPTPEEVPFKDIDPRFGTSTTVIRLYISENIAAGTDVYILLTGFENKSVLNAISGWAKDNGSGESIGGSTDVDTNNWKNGGMLGPEIIPWASKIILTVPNSAYTLTNTVTRTLPSDTTYGDEEGDPLNIEGFNIHNYLSYKLNTSPCIDFDSINLTDYYNQKGFTSALLRDNVQDVNLGFTASYNTLIAWYPGMTAAKVNEAEQAESNANFFPPALYATKIEGKGTHRLVPIDVAAPGTVKCFRNKDDAINYRNLLPNNYSVYFDGNTFAFVNGDNENTWYSSAKIDYLSNPIAKITTSTTSTKFVALNDSEGIEYNRTGINGEIASNNARNLIWKDMLDALKDGKSVNILGTRLTAVASELSSSNKIGVDTTNDQIAEIGATKLTVNPGASGVSITETETQGTKLATLGNGTSVKSGTNFYEFSNGLRLYISTTSPGSANVPVGSIGIGW